MFPATPIPRVDTLSRERFVADHKRPARPVVFEKLNRDWSARAQWNIEYIKRVAGHRIVPLYDGGRATERKYQYAPAARMPLRDYLQLLDAGATDLRMFSFNLIAGAPELLADFSYPDIGLRFFKRHPALFMAGRGAKVQMHFDIDLADILLCHFGGRKRVLLFSPDQTQYLYRVPFSFSSLHDIDYANPDFAKYPALRHARAEVAELHHGDCLYIPRGYWHYVVYEETGLSLSLRALPSTGVDMLKMLHNLLVTRSVEGVMRKLLGQRWNDRNERLAVARTHRHLPLTT